jgi:hypothetical protein
MEALILATYVLKTNESRPSRRDPAEAYYQRHGRTFRPIASAVAAAGRWLRT